MLLSLLKQEKNVTTEPISSKMSRKLYSEMTILLNSQHYMKEMSISMQWYNYNQFKQLQTKHNFIVWCKILVNRHNHSQVAKTCYTQVKINIIISHPSNSMN